MESPFWQKLFSRIIGILFGCIVGAFLFFWIGHPIGSTLTDSHTSWYLSRSTGMVAYVFSWFSMVTGLLITGRQAQSWPGVATTNDLHRQASLVSVIMMFAHVLVLLTDNYIGYTLSSLFIPDLNGPYAPIAVGIGQIALPVALIVTLTAEWRTTLGKAWRWIHVGAFFVFVAASIHGIYSGTDTRIPFVSALYVVAICSVVFLTVYRLRFRTLERQQRHVTQ